VKHAAPKKSRPAIEAEPFAQRTCHPFFQKTSDLYHSIIEITIATDFWDK
jgi:hypothetical protein